MDRKPDFLCIQQEYMIKRVATQDHIRKEIGNFVVNRSTSQVWCAVYCLTMLLLVIFLVTFVLSLAYLKKLYPPFSHLLAGLFGTCRRLYTTTNGESTQRS
ncbi:uncharacterized protein BDV17DRAFT_254816 [Aspergillus undulatus]|uniref:uncharacterized protein n=1 Tax=Aspergillus undulatus TaxID=1810928 RepID=UPI003CCD744A